MNIVWQSLDGSWNRSYFADKLVPVQTDDFSFQWVSEVDETCLQAHKGSFPTQLDACMWTYESSAVPDETVPDVQENRPQLRALTLLAHAFQCGEELVEEWTTEGMHERMAAVRVYRDRNGDFVVRPIWIAANLYGSGVRVPQRSSGLAERLADAMLDGEAFASITLISDLSGQSTVSAPLALNVKRLNAELARIGY